MFQKISSPRRRRVLFVGRGTSERAAEHHLPRSIATLARTGGRRGKGLVVCVAAGNNNAPVQDLGRTPAPTVSATVNWIIRSYAGPIDRWVAAHPDVITVSASHLA